MATPTTVDPVSCPFITAGDDLTFQIAITDSAAAAIPNTANVQVSLINKDKTLVYLGPFATAVQNGTDTTLWDITIPGGFAAGQTGLLLETPGSPDTSPLIQNIVDDENKLLIEVQADDVGSGFNETLHFEVTVDKGTIS
jgi:hypothetical protein